MEIKENYKLTNVVLQTNKPYELVRLTNTDLSNKLDLYYVNIKYGGLKLRHNPKLKEIELPMNWTKWQKRKFMFKYHFVRYFDIIFNTKHKIWKWKKSN